MDSLETEVEETVVDERRFDEILFNMISNHKKKIRTLQEDLISLLEIYQTKEADKDYSGYNLEYFETENEVKYRLVKRQTGFR